MTPEEVNEYRQRLTLMRAQLRNEVVEMADTALNKNRLETSGDLSSVPLHLADVGTDNFEQEFTLSLVQNSSETLEQIDLALERVKDGSYGICEGCECRIPKARLNAIPYASLCVKCATAKEEEYR